MDDILHEILPRASDDGHERGQRALVVTAVLTGIAALIVGMRLFARLGLMKITGREDWSVLIALIFSIIYLSLVAAQYHYKMGTHSALLSSEVLQKQLKCLWAAIPMYNASLAFTKFSILLQYIRIFPARSFRLACYVVMAIVATYSSWAIVSGYVNCVPVAKFWNHDLPGHCLNFEAVWFFNASMNILTDVILLVLPMPLLVKLQLPRTQKIALMGVFAIGILLRTVAQSTDTSYSNVDAAYWTAAECNVAIICACLPFLRPIISSIFPKLLSTNSYNRYTSNPRTNTRNITASRSQRQHTDLFSQNMDKDFDMYSINVKHGNRSSHSSFGGIEVTTEMTVSQESKVGENVSERRLVIESPPPS
ncbi:unnamed protein product [Penicillium pancosmium]